MNRIIVTGASGSMGSAAVRSLANDGYAVIMACRNLEKGEKIRQEILRSVPGAELELKKLDLNSLQGVRDFVASVEDTQLAGIFNNAGIINRDFSINKDGFESTYATNFLGPILLCHLLMDKIEEDGHIVNMVSLTCGMKKLEPDFLTPREERFSQLGTYAQSKLALMLGSIELAKRSKIKLNVADPGIVNSNMISMGRWFDPLADIFFRPFCSSPEKGVQPALNALKSEETLHLYKGKTHKRIPSRFTEDPFSAELWKMTCDALSIKD